MSKLNGSTQAMVAYFASIIKTTVSQTFGKPLFVGVSTMGMANSQGVEPSNLVAVCTNIPMTYEGAETATFLEACVKYDVTEEELSIGEITKEQFYNLEA